jgi:raffinose/stachyose/melibiose transport system substrate-binding protein
MLNRRRGLIGAISVMVAALLTLSACGSSSSGSGAQSTSSTAPVTLTFWENYGTQQTLLDAAKNLIAAYEKAHPNVTIKMVTQPANNYFSLLQASAISHTSPDLAVMWTGLYLPPYADILANVRPYIPASELNTLAGLKWGSQGFNASNAVLAMPVDAQFYMGFYNKKLFARAGITSVPTTWDQMYSACDKLKAIGVTPIVYGNASGSYGGEFQAWIDMSYMMIGAFSPNEWQSLYDGKIPWTSPKVQAQLTAWHQLYVQHCTNTDALTNTDNIGQFVSGKAAISMSDGSWDIGQLTKAMGSNVAPMVPPYSSTGQHGVVYFPGDGMSVMKSSSHIPQAAAFLAFMDSPAGAAQIDKAGLIPDIEGYKSNNALNNEMLDFISKDHYTVYPMLDNVTQPELVNDGFQVLPAALAGQTSVASAVQSLASKWHELPTGHRTSYLAAFGSG